MNIIKPYEISVFFVPYWVTESLKRRGVSQDIFNESVENIVKYLSPNDIASCIVLTRLMEKEILGYTPAGSEILFQNNSLNFNTPSKRIINNTTCFLQAWNQYCIEPNCVEDINSLFSTIDIMSSQPDVIESVKTRLFSSPDLRREGDKEPVTIHDISNTRAIVSVNPGFFNSYGMGESKKATLKLIYRGLRRKFQQHIVAGTMWFSLYLLSLS